MKYPSPLQLGSKIAVSAFSAGVPQAMHARLDNALAYLHSQGFEVLQGQCLRENHHYVSASADDRANELMQLLLDDQVDAIMPPWGGAVAMDILPLLDWQRLQQARPKWLIGFSDVSTLLTALTCKLGWASVHATNLMQLTDKQTDPLTTSLFSHLGTAPGGGFRQYPSSSFEPQSLDFAAHPNTGFNLSEPTQWRVLNSKAPEGAFSGRLLGGCLDIHMLLAGTEYFDLEAFAKLYPQQDIILYLENAELSPPAYYRALQSLKLRGWFSQLSGLLIGRNPVTVAEDSDWTHIDALQKAFAGFNLPVIYDVDIGHQAPNLTLINGALARVNYGAHFVIEQELR
ncbi:MULTISPECIES: S66 family peptidase [unclassified Pseudoalteromonas]|uniref:S66 family peptidase n=1 Tax=unclassified Pseudoalteromonas TaxID=194690 RepID=UPI0030147B6B